MAEGIDQEEKEKTEARYDRLAPVYDLMEALPERRFSSWRERLWAVVPPGRVLEVGVGTGKNMPYYPPDVDVVAIDLSRRMVARARRRATSLGLDVDVRVMDAQELDLPDDSFDAAVTTFVFCSVPDAVRGLREVKRVVKPSGKILLLEHVRVQEPAAVGAVMDVLDPLVVRVMGAHINRRTVDNVRKAGLEIERVVSLAPMDLVKLIVATPGQE